MIYTLDDFVDKDLFQIAENYLNDGPFQKHVSGGNLAWLCTWTCARIHTADCSVGRSELFL